MAQTCSSTPAMTTTEISDSTEASLPVNTCPYLVPLHECFILSAESLDLLVQLQVPLMIPLGHHVSGGLGDTTTKLSFQTNKTSYSNDKCCLKQQYKNFAYIH